MAGCSKRYTDPSSLRKHVKNHNQKEPTLKKKVRIESVAMVTMEIGHFGASCSKLMTLLDNDSFFLLIAQFRNKAMLRNWAMLLTFKIL